MERKDNIKYKWIACSKTRHGFVKHFPHIICDIFLLKVMVKKLKATQLMSVKDLIKLYRVILSSIL